jgi:hypothetical protein
MAIRAASILALFKSEAMFGLYSMGLATVFTLIAVVESKLTILAVLLPAFWLQPVLQSQ